MLASPGSRSILRGYRTRRCPILAGGRMIPPPQAESTPSAARPSHPAAKRLIDEPAPVRSYSRFAKRDLDKMSWLAPLVSNRFGDLLNIELRHEQLFFIQDDQVIEDIGYSE